MVLYLNTSADEAALRCREALAYCPTRHRLDSSVSELMTCLTLQAEFASDANCRTTSIGDQRQSASLTVELYSTTHSPSEFLGHLKMDQNKFTRPSKHFLNRTRSIHIHTQLHQRPILVHFLRSLKIIASVGPQARIFVCYNSGSAGARESSDESSPAVTFRNVFTLN